MITVTSGGSTARTDQFLKSMIQGVPMSGVEAAAQRGVNALQAATPSDTGLTAASWSFEIEKSSGSAIIWWVNTNVVNGFHVAIGLQYGHGTGTGGWVAGYDYINPALRPVFDEIADSVWKEVQRA